EGVFAAPNAQTCGREAGGPNREPQSHRADRRLLVDGVFEKWKRLLGTPGQSVGVAEAGEEVHVPGARWSNEREPTFERPARLIQIASLEMNAPESAERFEQRVEVIRRLGDAHRFLRVVDGFEKATEMSEREAQPGVRPGFEEARGQL